MKLHKVRHAGSIAFPSEISVDFDALPELVAVIGKTGSGKTTLLDLIPSALYLRCGYRSGPLYRHFATNGFIELIWSLDEARKYRSMILVDVNAGKVEANLYPEPSTEWHRHIAGPLQAEYIREVERLIGPMETFLASAYAVQDGSGAFLRADRSERRELLIDLMALQKYGKYEAIAKDTAKKIDAQVTALSLEAKTIEKRIADAGDLETGRLEAERALHEKVEALVTCRRELSLLNEAASEARANLARLDPLRDRLPIIHQDIARQQKTIDDAEKRIRNNQGVLERRSEIQSAVTRVVVLRKNMDDLAESADVKRKDKDARKEELASLQRSIDQQRNGHAALTDKIERRQHDARILADVPCHAEGEYASCQFIIGTTESAKEIPVLEDQIPQSILEMARLTQLAGNEAEAIHALGRDTDALSKQRIALERDLADAEKSAKEAGPLEVAEARIQELKTAIELARTTKLATEKDHAQVRRQLEDDERFKAEQIQAQNKANDMERRVRDLNSDTQRIERELGNLDARVTALTKDKTRFTSINTELQPFYQDAADWNLIAKACAPSGIPALKMDIALPEIGTKATELLRECFGDELFSLELVSQRPTADESKLKEVLDIIVHRGDRIMDANLLSGGEKALASESIGVAIALTNRAGRPIHTLLRDETAAALDTATAKAYAMMLRRIVKSGDIKTVLFVTHQMESAQIADAIITVSDGTISIS